MDRTLLYRISSEDLPSTVGEFLRRAGYSRHIITLLKRTFHGICLNGDPAFTNRTLTAGDVLSVFLKEEEPSSPVLPVSLPFPIIYQDEDLLVIDKPSGMAVHPSQDHHDNTLANAAAWYFSRMGEPFVFRCINRLDRDTTGLLILAKNALSAAVLSAQMKERRIRRTYLAAAEGCVPPEGTIDAPIGRVPGSLVERRVDTDCGDRAVTHFSRLALRDVRIPSGEIQTCSLVLLRLETGRTHQIRVHMASIGHPLAGDTLYNPRTKLLKRQGLHSYSLDFFHPVTGERMRFFSPLPQDMASLFPESGQWD